MKSTEEPPTDAAITQALSALKREGGTILVVGAVDEAHTDICGRFLGEEAGSILVSTDGNAGTHHEDIDPLETIECSVLTRSAAQSASSSVDISSIESRLRAAMREADTEKLRVCFDSLRPFVGRDSRIAPSLERLRETARETDAVVHIHLPAMADGVPEAILEAADAVVEVTRRNGTTYQQWRISCSDPDTGWVPV